MKTAGIIKIIVGCAVLAALAVVAVAVISGRSLWHNDSIVIENGQQQNSLPQNHNGSQNGAQNGSAGGVQNGNRVDDRDDDDDGDDAQKSAASAAAAVGDMRYTAADIRDIDIDWIAGNVEIVVGTGAELVLTESCAQSLTSEQQMRCTLINGELKVAYCDDATNVWRWFKAGGYNLPAKTLRIEMPASLVGTLPEMDVNTVAASVSLKAAYALDTDIKTVSGRLEINGVACRELAAYSTSGDIDCIDCSAKELDVEAVSGELELSGMFDRVDMQSISGDITLTCMNVPEEIDGETVSGAIRVTLPAEAEFTATLDTVSGELTSEFPCVTSKNRMICGSGANQYDFETVSGDVKLLKA